MARHFWAPGCFAFTMSAYLPALDLPVRTIVVLFSSRLAFLFA
jgi:hypothetical protein